MPKTRGFYVFNSKGEKEKLYVSNNFKVRNTGPNKMPYITNAYKRGIIKNTPVAKVPLTKLVNNELKLYLYDTMAQRAGVSATVPLIFSRTGESTYSVPLKKLSL